MKVKFNLNGRDREFEVSPNEYLLETLRNNHITSVKNGCNESTCGVCTVLLDGKPVLSCSVLSLKADGHQITTVDGLQKEVEHISEFFGEEGADQCGFCNTGLALTIYALKKEIKLLEKVKAKYEKEFEKKNKKSEGKSSKKEIIDENDDEPTEDELSRLKDEMESYVDEVGNFEEAVDLHIRMNPSDEKFRNTLLALAEPLF